MAFNRSSHRQNVAIILSSMGFFLGGDEMGVSPLIWRKKLMDSISGNLSYYVSRTYSTLRPTSLHNLLPNQKKLLRHSMLSTALCLSPHTLRHRSRCRGSYKCL